MTDTTTNDEASEDTGPGIEVKKNGHVVLTLTDGSEIELRRPKLGEYKELREQIVTSAETVKLITDPNQREYASMDAMVAWLWLAVRVVGVRGSLPSKVDAETGETGPDGDQFDFWLLMQQTQTSIMQAWQNVPLVRSA